MVSLLNREKIVSELNNMLCDAKEYIYLICPYFDLKNDSGLITSLETANENGVDINIIYSKGYKKRGGQDRLKKYKRVKLCYISDLHMKVYLTDKSAIVCSLNLHEYSIKNNLECGIFISREEKLWKDLYSMIKNDIYKNMIVEKKRDEYTWKENTQKQMH